ncbi:hypothetical protein [Tardiphaga sp. 619_E2_N8_5]|jgi:hypothetical protein|uniref:hypothetical protein n=1 Tax=unclassified Tardiphaga TaxID=2631404 RepID=UPI003F290E17
MIYAINYDLKMPGRDYSGLYEAIKSSGSSWWHYLGSTWLVDTTRNASGIWNHLQPHVDKNDYMLIIGVTNDNSGWLPKEAWDWINSRIKKAA